MNLTPEQLAQCRADYKKIVDNGPFVEDEIGPEAWVFFQAAWSPIPSVDEIEEIMCRYDGITPTAQAIHRAFGGKDHE